jgi:hypothetical protein
MRAKEFVQKMLALAKKYNKTVGAQIRVLPSVCDKACRGFHKTCYFDFTPNGCILYMPSPYGFHSVVYPVPKYRKISHEKAVRIIEDLMEEKKKNKNTDSLLDVYCQAMAETVYASVFQ